MPVTKKKGAIFAIYTDSPTHATTSTSTSRPLTSLSPTKKALRQSSSDKPIRRALTTLQSSTTKGFPSYANGKGLIGGKGSSEKVFGDIQKPNKPSLGKPLTIKTVSTKRQFEIFSSPPPEKLSHNTDPTPRSLAQPSESPAKRTRSSPRRPTAVARHTTPPLTVEKENVPPEDVSGSPATRTRSKTRSRFQHTSISSLSGLGISSPRARREIEGLVGDARGTFTLKKGRAIDVIMDQQGSPSKATKSKGVSRVGGLGVRPDAPLVDVSEAYGASGEEPEGFKTGGS